MTDATDNLTFPGIFTSESAPAPAPQSKKPVRKRSRRASAQADGLPHSQVAETRPDIPRQVTEVAVERITPSRYQSRLVFDAERMRSLQESVAHLGVLQPILVREPADGKYELIAGECRVRACRALGLKVIAAIIIAGASEEYIERMAITENSDRAGISAIEWCIDAHRKLEQRDELGEGTALREIGALYGIKKAEISRRLTIARAINAAFLERTRLDWGDLRPLSMRALYNIACIKDEHQRADALVREVERRSDQEAAPAGTLPPGTTVMRREKTTGVVLTEYKSGTRTLRINPKQIQSEAERQQCLAYLEAVRAWIDNLEFTST